MGYCIYEFRDIPFSRGSNIYAWTEKKSLAKLFKEQRDMSKFIYKKNEVSSADIKIYERRFPSAQLFDNPVFTTKVQCGILRRYPIIMALTLQEYVKISSDKYSTYVLDDIFNSSMITGSAGEAYTNNYIENLQGKYKDSLDTLEFYEMMAFYNHNNKFYPFSIGSYLPSLHESISYSDLKSTDDNLQRLYRFYGWSFGL